MGRYVYFSLNGLWFVCVDNITRSLPHACGFLQRSFEFSLNYTKLATLPTNKGLHREEQNEFSQKIVLGLNPGPHALLTDPAILNFVSYTNSQFGL